MSASDSVGSFVSSIIIIECIWIEGNGGKGRGGIWRDEESIVWITK